MILSVNNLTKSYDGTDIIRDISFHIESYDKLAITGANGAGKSTLLKQIAHEETPDRGTVTIPKNIRIGYLAQQIDVTSDNTIYDEVLSVKQYVLDMEDELRALEARMKDSADESLYERYDRLSHAFSYENGYAVRSNVTGILKGLGFAESEFTKKVSQLSGGQKTRLALSRLLLDNPDILMLDEPTNHLDIDSVSWLETFLKNRRGTVIIVSHDRYFLDHVVNKVFDIENGTGRLYTGNYTQFSEKKSALRREQIRAYLNNQAEIKHQQEVIDKLKQFNREKSIKRAESREKALAKIERVDKPIDINDAMKLKFTPSKLSGRDVLFAEGLSKSFGDNHLFWGVDLDVRRGEKLAIIGPNGSGKTTLLKIIRGDIPADTGELEFGTRVEVAYYDQEQHVLDPDSTVFDEISDAHPNMNNTEIRSLLAAFLFTRDDVFKYIRDLSGGEKGRLSLAKLMLSRANLILLDEPTNHLDITSKDILEEAVRNYEGTVIYVSHDRYFINRTATRILELDHGSFINYQGNYDYYLLKKSDPSFDRTKAISGTVPPHGFSPGLYSAKENAGIISGSSGYSRYSAISSSSGSDAEAAAYTDNTAESGYSDVRSICPEPGQKAAGRSAVKDSGSGEAAGKDAGRGANMEPTVAEYDITRHGSSYSNAAFNGQTCAPAIEPPASYSDQKALRAKARKLKNQIEKCEKEIGELETRISEIDEEMSRPEVAVNSARLNDLNRERTSLDDKLQELYEKWEELAQ